MIRGGPFVALSELSCLRHDWPTALFVFMSRYQHDLEGMRKEVKKRFGCMQSGNCTHCGKYIQSNLGKHIALFHVELAQLGDVWSRGAPCGRERLRTVWIIYKRLMIYHRQ